MLRMQLVDISNEPVFEELFPTVQTFITPPVIEAPFPGMPGSKGVLAVFSSLPEIFTIPPDYG